MRFKRYISCVAMIFFSFILTVTKNASVHKSNTLSAIYIWTTGNGYETVIELIRLNCTSFYEVDSNFKTKRMPLSVAKKISFSKSTKSKNCMPDAS